jgi:hypothetical protein
VRQLSDHGIDALLRAANPVPPEAVPDPAVSASAQALCQRILDRAAGPVLPGRPARRHSPRLRVSIASLLALVAAGAGVSYAVSSRGGRQKTTFACYAAARGDASFSVFPGTGGDPVAACRRAWASGAIPGVAPVANQSLQGCVLPGGTVGVYPVSPSVPDPCSRLGLPAAFPPNPGPTAAPLGDPVATMTASVTQALSAGCLDQASALTVVHSALDAAGLTTWTVASSAPFTAERPCASPGFDESQQAVLLIPVPRP